MRKLKPILSLSLALAGLSMLTLLSSARALGEEIPMSIKVESGAFKANEAIPHRHSAYGENISPALTWSDAPAEAGQFALIVDDPVAPTPKPFVHWVVYNIPGNAKGLPEGIPAESPLKSPEEIAGAIQGRNGLMQLRYFGPRPPKDDKDHLYHFKVYALDAGLSLPEGLNKDGLLKAIEGHVLAWGELVGTFRNEE